MPNRTHPHEVPISRPPIQVFSSVVVREGHLDTLGCKSRFPDLAPPSTGVGGFLSLPPISPPPGRSVSGAIPGRQWFWPVAPAWTRWGCGANPEPGHRGGQRYPTSSSSTSFPVLRRLWFCDSTAGLPGPLVTEMANSAAVEPLDLEPQNPSFNPRFFLRGYFIFSLVQRKMSY